MRLEKSKLSTLQIDVFPIVLNKATILRRSSEVVTMDSKNHRRMEFGSIFAYLTGKRMVFSIKASTFA